MASAALAVGILALSYGAGQAVELTNNSSSTVGVARGEDLTEWVALAASPNGRVFKSEPKKGEEMARNAARSECQQTSGRTCSVTISVPSGWDVEVLRCGSAIVMGGSGQSNARGMALDKAAQGGYSAQQCTTIANY